MCGISFGVVSFCSDLVLDCGDELDLQLLVEELVV
jgi:hypothetical protein